MDKTKFLVENVRVYLAKFGGKSLFWVVICDVRVSDNTKKHFFAQMPSIFKKHRNFCDNTGLFMKEICERLNEFISQD